MTAWGRKGTRVPPDDDPSEIVIDAFVEYEQRVSDGYDSSNELERYKTRLGAEYRSFEDLVRAREAIMEVVDPPPVDGLPEQFGPFTLMGVLGSGGSGMVYDAYDPGVQRHVAVKLLRGGFERDGETFKRFLREAAAAAKVVHPNIVTIHCAGEHDRRPFLAMERIDGPTLKAWVRDRPPVRDYLTTASRIADIADALSRLHAAGVVHRDVKPSNIMVRADGSFVLMDFGLAHGDLGTTVTRTGEVIGTPVFMSPQQLRGDRATAADDVYGIGLTLYYLLTSKAALQDVTPLAELARRRAVERPPMPDDPGIPAPLVEITRACLEVEPADRPTAAELSDGLRSFVRGEPAHIRPVSSVVHSRRRLRKVLPIVFVAATVVGLLLYGWFTRRVVLEVDLEGALAMVRLEDEDIGVTPVRTRIEAGRSYGLWLRVAERYTYLQQVKTDGDLRLTFRADDLTELVATRDIPRGEADRNPVIFSPRGGVRARDLQVVRLANPGGSVGDVLIHVDSAAEVGPIVHRHSGGETVTVPDLVLLRETVQLGATIRIEMRTAEGETVAVSQAEVVEDDPVLDEEIRGIEQLLASRPDAERRFYVSRLLARRGLRTAALDHLMDGWPEASTPEHAPLWAGLYLLLREMEPERGGLATATALADQIAERIDELPDAVRREWFDD